MKLLTGVFLIFLNLSLYAMHAEKEKVTVGEMKAGIKVLAKHLSFKRKSFVRSTHDSLEDAQQLLRPHKHNFSHDVV